MFYTGISKSMCSELHRNCDKLNLGAVWGRATLKSICSSQAFLPYNFLISQFSAIERHRVHHVKISDIGLMPKKCMQIEYSDEFKEFTNLPRPF